MTVYNKAKWILAIIMIFAVIVTTNLIDRDNFSRVRDSVVIIYEDRLVAKGYLLELVASIHEKEVAIIRSDTAFFEQKNNQVNDEINVVISSFIQTRFTKAEEQVFNKLNSNLLELKTAEGIFIKNNLSSKEPLIKLIVEIKGNLKSLSKIQLEEGSKLMSISDKAIDVVELFTQMEIYILIFLAILIQIIILYNPKK